MKPMFRTEKGSTYFKHEDGNWSRQKYDGRTISDFLYVGSINASQNPAFPPAYGGYLYNEEELTRQVCICQIPGFEPNFKVGFLPLGILGCEPDDVTHKEGRLSYRRPVKISLHVGDKIIEVFKGE